MELSGINLALSLYCFLAGLFGLPMIFANLRLIGDLEDMETRRVKKMTVLLILGLYVD